MGQFKIEIYAVGGHGCDRIAKNGEEVRGCNNLHCPDCRTREFVRILKSEANCNVESAELVHWPNTEATVIDNLISKRRTGSFGPRATAAQSTPVANKDMSMRELFEALKMNGTLLNPSQRIILRDKFTYWNHGLNLEHFTVANLLREVMQVLYDHK